jgi:hypothetical protein
MGCAGTPHAGMVVGSGVGCQHEDRPAVGPTPGHEGAMERIPPELGAATSRRHQLIVEGREELLYLLGEAAELEHAVCCACTRHSACGPTPERDS